jgi:hypothetical protein
VTASFGHRSARVVEVLVLTFAMLAAAGTPASAKIVHRSEGMFNGADAPNPPLGSLLVSDAVDATNGDVYVLESNAFAFGVGLIDKFTSAGKYAGVQILGEETPEGAFAFGFSPFGLPASGVAVDNSGTPTEGDVYVSDSGNGVVDRFSGAGAFLGQIAGGATPQGSLKPAGVAVDSSGNVFVADDEHRTIDEFSPSGAFIGQIVDSHLSESMGTIALASDGSLYVENSETSVVRFDAQGHFAGVLVEGDALGVGVDPNSGHVYVARNQAIAEYDGAGTFLDEFPAGAQGFPDGLAIAGTSGRIYVAVATFGLGGHVEIFGPGLILPTVSVSAATDVGPSSATLNGEVDPDAAHGGGAVTECQFEFVTDAAFKTHPSNRYEDASKAPCHPGGGYSAATKVSANIAISPSTVYHFRLAAANALGLNDGDGESADEATLTSTGPPAVEVESSTARTTYATVRARINTFGSDATCGVQYVSNTDFVNAGYTRATESPCSQLDVGSEFGGRPDSATLTGLMLDTEYHFRFVVRNELGTAVGPDETFATFGIHAFDFEDLGPNGEPYTLAGGHPYKVVATFAVNSTTSIAGEEGADANIKDVLTNLPPGLVGNPSAVRRCTRDDLTNYKCPGSAQVGVLHLHGGHGDLFDVGLYNLVPPAGVPAEVGAKVSAAVNVYVDFNIRTGEDYGINASVTNASTGANIGFVSAEFWGVPSDPSHDAERACPVVLPDGTSKEEAPPCSADEPLVPFLTNPTSCNGPETATLSMDSWQVPGAYSTKTSKLPAMTGCDGLPFSPSISVAPDSASADSPSGLRVDLRFPFNENPSGRGQSSLRDVATTLPVGVSVSPSAANGLEACSPTQIGLNDATEPSCPDASKIGEVEVISPLLADHLKGSVYVAEQTNNPFNSLLAIYVTAEADGALIKLAGHVVADPITGQLTTTFDDNPQLPFTDLKLDLFGGPHGALATPESCGSFATTSTLTPWSGTASVSFAEPFQISSACVAGFSPAFRAGASNPEAGAPSPFVLSFSRSDTDQEFSGLSVSLPPGLLAKIAGVPLCPDAAATTGTCPQASQVGTVQAGAGPGSDPLFLPGRAYLTGSYKRAPFGLAVVVPAIAGPFELGTVVVRQALYIDSRTAQVTAVSDRFPEILQGIPIRLRRVDVSISRPAFTLNPTDCEPTAVAGTIRSTGGLSVAVSSRFQVAGCGELPFNPRLSATTQALTSKANGASLTVKVTQRPREANIHKVDLQLPRTLPSRLTTLQKACTASQFDVDPAGCPPGSDVGSASAITPLLNVALTGPAYLVSHGSAAFPDLEFVLQGEGVEIVLDGETDIKRGVTYSEFETVPDAPISSFTASFPQGPHSVLSTSKPGRTDLCVQSLIMPTVIVGQNGARVKRRTKVAVTGCNGVTISKRKLSRKSVVLAFNLATSGIVTVLGRGVKRYRSTLSTGLHQIKVRLSKAGLRLRKQHEKIEIKVALRSGRKMSSATTTLAL